MNRAPADLFRLPLLGSLLSSPILQRVLQWGLLAGYAGLVVLGLGRDTIPGVPELHPRMYTHATTLLFWVIWLMGLIFLTPITARAWCAVCPLGYVTDVLGRRGLGLRWPRWIRAGWGTLAVFACGLFAVVVLEAHRSPHRTALVIGLAGLAALVSALIWRRSAFCRGLCPVGSVLHLYSRCAPLRILPADADGCTACSRGGCVDRRNEWRRWDVGRWVFYRQVSRGGCPVALYPPTMDTGECLLCLRCVRNCPEGNLGVYWAGGESRPLDGARLGMLVVVLGLVGFALVRTWPWMKAGLAAGLDPAGGAAGAWLVVGLPLLLVGGPAMIGGLLDHLRGSPVEPPIGGQRPPADKNRKGIASRTPYGLLVLPLIGPLLGAHAALALVKLNAKGGYLPYLFYDPEGAATYLAIHAAGQLPLPDLLLPLVVLRWLALGVFSAGVAVGAWRARSLWTVQWAVGRPAVAALYGLSFLLVSGGLGAALVHWLF